VFVADSCELTIMLYAVGSASTDKMMYMVEPYTNDALEAKIVEVAKVIDNYPKAKMLVQMKYSGLVKNGTMSFSGVLGQPSRTYRYLVDDYVLECWNESKEMTKNLIEDDLIHAMDTEESISDFFAYARKVAPAKKYVVIFAGSSNGYLPYTDVNISTKSILRDDNETVDYSHSHLGLEKDLEKIYAGTSPNTLEAAYDNSGMKPELTYLDCDYSNLMEIITSLQGTYVLASNSKRPTESSYAKLLQRLSDRDFEVLEGVKDYLSDVMENTQTKSSDLSFTDLETLKLMRIPFFKMSSNMATLGNSYTRYEALYQLTEMEDYGAMAQLCETRIVNSIKPIINDTYSDDVNLPYYDLCDILDSWYSVNAQIDEEFKKYYDGIKPYINSALLSYATSSDYMTTNNGEHSWAVSLVPSAIWKYYTQDYQTSGSYIYYYPDGTAQCKIDGQTGSYIWNSDFDNSYGALNFGGGWGWKNVLKYLPDFKEYYE